MEAQPITLAVKAHFENVHPKTEGLLILTEYGARSSAKYIGAGNTSVDKAHSEIVASLRSVGTAAASGQQESNGICNTNTTA